MQNDSKQAGGIWRRPAIGSVTLSAIVALYLVFLTNFTFWSRANTYLADHPGALIGLYVGLSFLFIAVVIPFSIKYVTKAFFILLIAAAGSAAWFMDRFGVVIDSDMIRNAAETTPAEANHLITPEFLLHMALFVVLPILLVLWVRVVHRPVLQKIARNTAVVAGSLVIVGIVSVAFSKPYTAAIRQHRDLVKMLNPVTPISGAVKYLILTGREKTIIAKPLGQDATLMPPLAGLRKPRVTIIVAGETARAANFSLNGYSRETDPELKKRDVIYFPNTESCGTATATSLPCMFSNLTRAGYSHAGALAQETLVDVLAHAGLDVAWWDNNTGSKGVADRIKYIDLANTKDPTLCTEGECKDAIFLDRLDAWLDSVTKDSVLVLHQLGSHGPTYYLRYPEEFRRFKPDCRTAEIANCSDEEIVNAYDNTILYTDHFLSEVIDRLAKRSDKLASSMLYMSDHGESLGESGLYLHGTPYLFAPDVQTHVPFVVWLDEDFARSIGVDRSCLSKEAAAGGRSHDNLFHSVLGMTNVQTSIYDKSLDVFSPCKTGVSS
ncbi:lipid A ethanolaminephosphotransferase [Pararhizobium capsulatum DSM 1112]|uniref:Lipid A ethanolaminephosphotransferase n=1 Tax=Pararhizobium capsulatum DSM 1112 TaxID=1121113 RepID=A0ABU0BJN7_9HYPH|nr:phosphoethanolamine--lipid A transferase [Pararhizobium capsulatum]MDQ0318462.1 lipid A ethanolaminephosphotransferase [Pararhizobium capsulatum DSM 1112]